MRCSSPTALVLAALVLSPAAARADDDYMRYSGHAVVRALVSNERELATMLDLSPDCWCEAIGIGTLDFRIPPASMARLEASGIPFEVLIPDLEPLIVAEHERLAAGAADGADWYDDYHSLAEYHQRMQDLAAAHPDFVSIVELGDSLEGRSIIGLRISGPGDDKPGLLINGCQHAREWVSPMVNMYVADELIAGYGADPEITGLVNGLEIFVIPFVNPDGYEHSWNVQRLWRKNRRPHGGGEFGVDTNRNWGFAWASGGSSSDPGSDVYHGAEPFSEPETQAMRDFYLAHPNIVAGIDFHSYGQLNLYPWGYTTGGPSDGGVHDVIAEAMVDAIASVHGMNYIAGPIMETLYQASGNAVDWMWGDQGVYAFTIELRDTGAFGFELPAAQIRPTVEENLEATIALAESVLGGVIWSIDPPTLIPAEEATEVVVQVVPATSGPLDPALGALHWRAGGTGAYTTEPMTFEGGTTWLATLPALPCGTQIEYYFEVVSEAGAAYTAPIDAPTNVYAAETTVFSTAFEDDFEADLGWVVASESLTGGAWERGVPAGDGTRGDPVVDGDGSGACYLTENGAGNTDVDGGPTRLTSPAFDLTGLDDPTLAFHAWFYNDDQDIDRLFVELSDDGGTTWTEAVALTNTSGWSTQQLRIADFVALTDAVHARFSAVDQPNDSVTEAGIDGVRVFDAGCDGTPGDVNGDGVVDVIDLLAVLSAWGPCAGCPEDIDGNGLVDVGDLLAVLGNWS